jgi:hypothetical protein
MTFGDQHKMASQVSWCWCCFYGLKEKCGVGYRLWH